MILLCVLAAYTVCCLFIFPLLRVAGDCSRSEEIALAMEEQAEHQAALELAAFFESEDNPCR